MKLGALLRAVALLGALVFTAAPSETTAAPSETQPPVFVQAVDFPYYLYPRELWERELVWLKSIGVDTVKFAIPWNWHQTEPGTFDFTGRTSPRRDLQSFVRLLRHLGLHAWINAVPDVSDWPDGGRPAGSANPGALVVWQKAIADQLTTQTVSHGGPVEFAEGVPQLDAPRPPGPVTQVSAIEPGALARSREAIGAAHGSLVWTEVEDRLYPEGWAKDGMFLRHGAVGLAGNDRAAAVALRRAAMLLRGWEPLLPALQRVAMPKPAEGKLPEGVTASELSSPAAAAVRITNARSAVFQDELRVGEPVGKRVFVIPGVAVPPGQSLWLPVSVSLGPDGLCRGCTHFANTERLMYATAELLSIEYENGILAMEFSAPVKGEAVLQLVREPVGPYLAAGKPGKFDWDDKALRARLPIPAGSAPDYRVRVGIAMEEPEASAFFNDAKRLILGAQNTLSTAYSSPDVASRSRLLLPDGFTSKAVPKTPNEIDFEVMPPPEAVHGDSADLALETDGLPMGRARVQLMRPLSLELRDALTLHLGQRTELRAATPVVAIDPKGGSTVELSLRNNWPAIRTYKLQLSSDTLDIFPSRSEVTIGPLDERRVTLRVFGKDGFGGRQPWTVKVSGGADLEVSMECVLVPKNQTVVWNADLDGDGSPEWILESSRVRAVFSSQDGGRWMEFTWKDGGVNFLPEQGAMAGQGPVDVHAESGGLIMKGNGWTRRIRLSDAAVTMDQTGSTLPEGITWEKRGNRTLTATPEPGGGVKYLLQ